MVLSELKAALEDLERIAHHDMTGAQTSIWGDDPGHIVMMHARFLGCAVMPPKEDWNWPLIRESWRAILTRRHLPFVEDWLSRHGARIGAYFDQASSRDHIGPIRLADRTGRVHTLFRA